MNPQHHPAIIDEELFGEVQLKLDKVEQRFTRASRAEDYTYYLHGRVHCPHCNSAHSNSHAKGGQVFYYECLNKKKNSKTVHCPAPRINCDALHSAVLREIRRGAEHHTVMHKFIASSKGWHGADESVLALRGDLGKRKGQIDLQVLNITNAIGYGKAVQPLVDRLEVLTNEKGLLLQQMEELDEQIAKSTVKRPTAGMVQRVWQKFLALWEYASEEERSDLMRLLVKEVQVQKNDSVDLHLNPIADFSEFKVRINSKIGSGERI